MKKIKVVLVEHIGESNNWEWYSLARNITPEEALKEYCEDIMETETGVVTLNKKDGYYYSENNDDVRATIVTI